MIRRTKSAVIVAFVLLSLSSCSFSAEDSCVVQNSTAIHDEKAPDQSFISSYSNSSPDIAPSFSATESSTSYIADSPPPLPAEIGFAMEAYSDALQNKIGIDFSYDRNGTCNLDSLEEAYSTDCQMQTTLDSFLDRSYDGKCKVDSFSIIDLDDDGIPEVVLQLSRVQDSNFVEESIALGYCILHLTDGMVMGITFVYRQFYLLKLDGSFHNSGSSANWGFNTITFQGCEYIIDRYTYCESALEFDDDLNENRTIRYYVNHEVATRGEFDAEVEIQESKPDAIWCDYTMENIEREFAW